MSALTAFGGPSTINIDLMRPWSSNGQIYRAFDHFIATSHGVILACPVAMAIGGKAAIDACPVPWEEMVALLDDSGAKPLPLPFPSNRHARDLVALVPEGWRAEQFQLHPHGALLMRYVHPSGLRCGVAGTEEVTP